MTPPGFALWLTAQVQVPSTPDQLETQERGYCRVARYRLPQPPALACLLTAVQGCDFQRTAIWYSALAIDAC